MDAIARALTPSEDGGHLSPQLLVVLITDGVRLSVSLGIEG